MNTVLPLRDILKTELAKRCDKNPRYSLRSFAKSLDLSPAFVSKLLKGDRPFTEKTIEVLSKKMIIEPHHVEHYKRSLTKTSTDARSKELVYRQIGLDQFQFISDWYHFAILELVTVDGFNASPKWIAKELNINIHQASAALERLLRLGYLKKNKKNKIILVTENNTIIGPEIAAPATRTQQTQILEKALEALIETPIEKRSQTSSTMAIPSERLPEAKELIAEFRRKMANLMQRPGKRDSVYQLSISFFPLTKN